MSKDTIYKQCDPRWGNSQLGTSNSTLCKEGCLVTCLADLAGMTPPKANSKLTFTNKKLVNWTSANNLGLRFVSRVRSYDNSAVLEAIKKYGYCLVEVDYDGNAQTRDTHWVIFIGGGLLLDPLTGQRHRTSKYPELIGFAIIEGGWQHTDVGEEKYTEEQMTEVRLERDKNWDLYKAEKKAHEQTKQELSVSIGETKQRKNDFEEFRAEVAKRLMLPVASDEVDLLSGIERALSAEDAKNQLEKELARKEAEFELERQQMLSEIADLSNSLNQALEKQQQAQMEAEEENKKLRTRLKELEDRITKSEEKRAEFEPFKRILEILEKMFT